MGKMKKTEKLHSLDYYRSLSSKDILKLFSMRDGLDKQSKASLNEVIKERKISVEGVLLQEKKNSEQVRFDGRRELIHLLAMMIPILWVLSLDMGSPGRGKLLAVLCPITWYLSRMIVGIIDALSLDVHYRKKLLVSLVVSYLLWILILMLG